MSVTVVRGHTFDISDIATADGLNDLIRRATIAGLTIADFPGSSAQISTFSAPASAPNGWVSAQYDPLFLATQASGAEFNYVLTSPGGQVALFKPAGLETRRFFAGQDSYAWGSALLIRALGAPSATLHLTAAYNTGFPQHQFLGGGYNTAASGTMPRLIVKGFVGANVVDAGPGSDVGLRHYYYLLNASTAQFQHSAGVTNTDKVMGVSVQTSLTGNTIIPAFLYGAPIWRA